MTAPPAILRAPPFPGMPLQPMEKAFPPHRGSLGDAEKKNLFSALRNARVGGEFWGEPCEVDLRHAVILRPRTCADTEGFGGWLNDDDAHIFARGASRDGVPLDPWSVLPAARLLVAHGDDEWIALARAARLPVKVLSAGLYGSPEDGEDTLDAKALEAIDQSFLNPFGRGRLAAQEAIDLLNDWRRVLDGNRAGPGQKIVAACGMAWWKRREIGQFLWTPGRSVRIFANSKRALRHAQKQGGALAIWPSRVSPALLAEAAARNVPVVRVEDGFVRSVGLGSDLVPPSSIIVDRRGIHYDPSSPSDLEAILAQTDFSQQLQQRARTLREMICAKGISKYGTTRRVLPVLPSDAPGRRIVLVPGQVENDRSVLAGRSKNVGTNLDLLRAARTMEPDAEIWWRPHPDVDAGHRTGAVTDGIALKYADRIIRGGSIADLLDRADAVHVLSSQTGFEGLMRGLEVTCHGTPFYAGWGLTRDLGPVPARRGRRLSVDELVAGVLLLYPRYLDPVTALPCPPEVLIERMATQAMPNRLNWVGPLRRLQGRIMNRFRSSRKPSGMSA